MIFKNNLLIFLLFSFILQTHSFFINIKFPTKFKIKNKEVSIVVTPNVSEEESEILKSINGFYGLIGPDINMTTIDSLYDLFTGDGNVQGVFLENGKINYVKQFIKTEKIKYEEENGKMPKNIFFSILFMFLNKIKLTPNMMGLANTAILKANKKIYALFERDVPYLINVDFEKKIVDTVSKIDVKSIENFSGHSKFYKNKIETIEYNIMENTINYYLMKENFDIIQKVNIKTNYIPIIHDFLTTDNKVIVIDSPLRYDKLHIFTKKIPIFFDKSKKSIIHIISKLDNETTHYTCNNSFYLFHYAYYKESPTKIEIYAPLYDDLNFMNLNIKGNYRKLVIDKETKTVGMISNPELENYNLDFPISFDDKIVLRNIEGNNINGFIICKELDIVKKIFFENKFLCGEPAVMYQNKMPYLMFFSFDKKGNGYFNVMNLRTYKNIEILLPNVQMNIGFHSIYIPK